MLLSFVLRTRGSLILDPETEYKDINSKNALETTNGYIKIDAAVGLYENKNKKRLFVIFNPTHIEDNVYIENKLLRDYYTNTKYVHKDVIQSDDWDLGIDEPEVRYIIAKLITVRMSYEARKSCVEVAKFCSNFISYVDGNQTQGLIEDYSEYSYKSNPWRSTKEVLLEYIKINKQNNLNPGMHHTLPKSVKYGHCFVFACVFQSFMRSFGIPCRCIVNLQSSHDIVRDVIIATKEGDERPQNKFHVWNEVWMNRPDLNTYRGFGWQIIDTTPQGFYSQRDLCDMKQTAHGPCPLKAIYDISPNIKHNLLSICGEINSINVTYLLRNHCRYIYDITYRRNCNEIIGECNDGEPYIKTVKEKQYSIYPLSSVRSSYINDKINPITRLFDRREYIADFSFEKGYSMPMSYNSIFKFSVILRNNRTSKRIDPSLYTTSVLISLERDVGPYEPNEIDSKTVHEYPGRIDHSSWKFNLDTDCFTRVQSGCKMLHSHSKKCKIPTLKVVIQKSDSRTCISSQVKLYTYQYIFQAAKSSWVNRPTGI